jgi:hypothetical protein
MLNLHDYSTPPFLSRPGGRVNLLTGRRKFRAKTPRSAEHTRWPSPADLIIALNELPTPWRKA